MGSLKGHDEIIALLNDVLVGELTAINQYFLHARMCKDWGYEKIAAKIHAESIDEMKHASDLTDRILLLKGVPNFQKLDKLRIGENVKEQLESDKALEEIAIARLKPGIELCYKHHDHTSRELLERILKDEENHLDWIESQLGIIAEIGFENYLAQQIHP